MTTNMGDRRRGRMMAKDGFQASLGLCLSPTHCPYNLVQAVQLLLCLYVIWDNTNSCLCYSCLKTILDMLNAYMAVDPEITPKKCYCLTVTDR